MEKMGAHAGADRTDFVFIGNVSRMSMFICPCCGLNCVVCSWDAERMERLGLNR